MLLILCVLIIGIFASCNIFDWLYPDEETSDNAEDLVAQGDAALQNGDVDKALECYKKAVDKDSKNSKARWGYVKAYILKKNVDLILIASKLTAGADPSSVISSSASSITNTMNNVIQYLDPIAHGQCDGAISSTSFEVNLNLMIAYMVRGFLKNGDSNADNIYFSIEGSGGGDLFIFKNGEITYNPNVANIESYQSDLENTFNSILASLKTSPPSKISRSSVSNILYIAHNLTEDLLYVYKIMGSSFADFSGGMYALYNGIAGLSTEEVVEDLKKEMEKRYNEAKGYLDGADDDTANLSHDHLRIVGTNMIGDDGSDNWYYNFNKSSWDTHSNPPTKSISDWYGKTNLYRRFLNKSGDYLTNPLNTSQFTNDLIFISDLTNTISKIFRDIEESNLLKNLIGIE